VRVTLISLNYPPEPTGIALYSGGLADGLAKRRHDVRVVSGLPHYPQWRVYAGYQQAEISYRPHEDAAEVSVARRRHFVPPDPRLFNRLFLELTFGLSALVARWHRPDVVVVISPALFASILVALRARLLRQPFLVWVQDIYSLGVSETGRAGKLTGRVLGLVERLLLKSASRVVTIHERFRLQLIREHGLDPDRVSVIRNWSHIDAVPHGDRRAARAKLDWPPDTTVVLHAGNMGAKQGLMNVLDASRLAEAEGRKLLFVLMGDGNQRAELEAAEGNACLRILDPLPQGQFFDALWAADVLLVNERAGLTEMAVPSKLTSYFATGLPVVAATDAGSVTAQEVGLAGAGLRVDADDPRQLVDAAQRLRDDPVLAAKLGARGQAFRQSALTAEGALAAFEDVLLSASALVDLREPAGSRH